MRIKELELKNIRSHKQSILNLDNGITVLSGRTGSGKSSFLMSVEYALFGADTNLTNQSILRRDAKEGYVKIIFENEGKDYEIMRGLEKKGSSIIASPNKLWIKEEGEQIPIIARSGEVNQKILEILKYPLDVKPKELFEITSYAKQDEIRKLIELTKENRQRYIDRVLQLSKYQLTWDNLKELINELREELAELKGKVENLPQLKKDLVDKKIELERRQSELRSNKEKSDLIKDELNRLKSIIIDKTEELDSIEESNKRFEIKRSQLESLEENKRMIAKEVALLKEELKNKPLVKVNIELLVEKKSSIKASLNHSESQVKDLNKELESINSLKKSCPLCKQGITDYHKKTIKEEYDNRIKELNNKISALNKDLSIIEPQLKDALSKKELFDKLKIKESLLDDKTSKLNDLTVRINALKEEMGSVKIFDSRKLKEELKDLTEKDKDLSSSFKAISSNNNLLGELINSLLESISVKDSELKKLESEELIVLKIEQKLSLISRLRDDIRNIREVVRAKFLEDFRHEFQNKFEEIRDDDEYSVEIMSDYEPVAYSNSVETPVSSLSGGEKTSVALAYRLALSEIAARLSDVEHSEVLILDEPTIGFDRNDVKALPGTLKNIKTIPQIIIVSHVDELKDAADIVYEVNKVGGSSVVKRQ